MKTWWEKYEYPIEINTRRLCQINELTIWNTLEFYKFPSIKFNDGALLLPGSTNYLKLYTLVPDLALENSNTLITHYDLTKSSEENTPIILNIIKIAFDYTINIMPNNKYLKILRSK